MHIIGASGHGKVILDIFKALDIEISGVWDDSDLAQLILDCPVRGSFDAFLNEHSSEVIIAVGNNAIRKKLALKLEVPSSICAIHPSSVISRFVSIGKGTVVMANATINADAIIGDHVIVNTNASIDHDCNIGNFVHVSPQAGVAGNVNIGEGAHIGIGACIIQGINIGKWATVGAGTVIVRDVPDYAVVVGNPGRIIKYNKPL